MRGFFPFGALVFSAHVRWPKTLLDPRAIARDPKALFYGPVRGLGREELFVKILQSDFTRSFNIHRGPRLVTFGGSLVLASALEGRLLDGEGGRPVSGVTIKRNWSWAWTNREGSDETVTDSEGRFRFQEVVGRSPLAQSKPSKALICPAVQWPGALALGCLPPKQGLEWLCRAKENTRATSQLSVGALPSIRTGCQTSMLLCLLVRVAYPCIRGFAVSTTLWSRELKMPCAAATQPRST